MKNFIFIITFLCFYNFNNIVIASESGLKELVKSQQNKIVTVEKTLKSLIGKIENLSNKAITSDTKELDEKLQNINDSLKIIKSKLGTLEDFSFDLEFKIRRLERHLSLSSNFKDKKISDNIEQPKTIEDKKQIKKDNLASKTPGVLGYVKEKQVKNKTPLKSDKKISDTTKNNNNTILPDGNIEDRFNFALNFASKGNYEKSELAFKEFIKAHPDNTKTADAKYWLGRMFFSQKKYEEAAIALAEFNSLYPDDSRFQETTLIIAESATYFAPKDQLCEILNQSIEFMTDPSQKFVNKIMNLKKQRNCP